MKAIRNIMAYIFILVIPFTGLQAQDIIQASDLAKIMKQSDVIVVSARTPADYEKVHITGAVNINHNDLYGENTILLPAANVAKQLGAVGITASKTIILYDGGSEKYSGRMYWILKYMGATDVKILDGGMPAWKAARKPVTRSATSVKGATFTAKVHPEYLATMAEVQKAANGGAYIIIDARAANEFDGTNPETTLDRPGHVPSAINIEYTKVLDDKGKLKSNADIQAVFTKNGVTKDKTVIVYCKTSVRAGIIFHVLTSALDYPNVKVYDGAYLEWQLKSSNKVLQ